MGCTPRFGPGASMDMERATKSIERAELLIARLLQFLNGKIGSDSLWWPWRWLDHAQRGTRARWNFIDHACCHGAAAGDDPELIYGVPTRIAVLAEEAVLCTQGGHRTVPGFAGAVYAADVSHDFKLYSTGGFDFADEYIKCREPTMMAM